MSSSAYKMFQDLVRMSVAGLVQRQLIIAGGVQGRHANFSQRFNPPGERLQMRGERFSEDCVINYPGARHASWVCEKQRMRLHESTMGTLLCIHFRAEWR
ncbi:hypothetical protein [Serratia entomophila]|uniref:hypothetical protein n=1 Tax=Serratia entomophila TaxID=42906 RepID=UPI0021BA958E|nr:hypothetical protein [Serratia entomophila]